MIRKGYLYLILGCLIISGISCSDNRKTPNQVVINTEKDEANDAQQALYSKLRAEYDFNMIKDPVTGTLPRGIFQQEIEFAKTIPEKGSSNSSRLDVLNTYLPAGPNNIGGRTRALAYDMRYDGTTNKVILAGCVSGGIMRSADGGATWTLVTPANNFHNVTVLKQDPRPGFQDIWYAGTGEAFGNTASENGAFYVGNGFFVSDDNGVTWQHLSISGQTPEQFDAIFDIIYNIAISPVNGDVYFATVGNLFRFHPATLGIDYVFPGALSGSADDLQADVICNSKGGVYFALNGGSAVANKRGVWWSSSGDSATFTRIAGGSTLNVDSVAGWRGNDYTGGSKRILMSLAPSNDSILYVLYENGLSNASPDFKPEADLFKLDKRSGNNVWTNLSSNMPDFPGGNNSATDPFAVQGGYDMFITVKPDNPNFVLLGGTSLYRSTDGFATTANTSWIGGYGPSSVSQPDGFVSLYPNSHADIHNAVFNPSNYNEVLCSNDGGVQKTANITTAGNGTVGWNMINNYQTLQYYHVSIDPDSGYNNFLGGSQDNGTRFRDKTSILNTAAVDSNNHILVNGGDGGYNGMSSISGSTQYIYVTSFLGSVNRRKIASGSLATSDNIRPNNLTPTVTGSTTQFGEFTTNIRLDQDNTSDLYYINFNRLFRTTSASTVTSSSWTEMTGVSQAIDASNSASVGIRAIAFSRGPYVNTHTMYMGTTSGRVYRLDDPRNAVASASPVNITPTSIIGQALNIQDIAVNPNDDNEIMIVASNYGRTINNTFENIVNIWWTNNAKSANPAWKNAEGNLSGTSTSGYISARSCAIVVKKDASNNPVTEYYVGTAAGLYSVENLGTTLLASGSPTWQREGSSTLNLAVVQSLAYRPQDNVLLVGTHGNGMYYANIGSPNFTPNLSTGINDPILNDKNFIRKVLPTISSNTVSYKVGNMFNIKKISVQVLTMSGQQLYRSETAYQDGSINIARFASGIYILSINSDDLKYRHLQKIIKQ